MIFIKQITFEQAKSLEGPHAKNVGHNPKAQYFGAFDGSVLIGPVGILQRGEIVEYCGDIVLPEYRKQGVYSALYGYREGVLHGRKFKKAIAYCTPYSLGIYLAHGFTPLRQYKISTKVEKTL